MRSYRAPLHNIPKATFLPSFGLLWILILFVLRRNFEWLRTSFKCKNGPLFLLKVKSLELRYLENAPWCWSHIFVKKTKQMTILFISFHLFFWTKSVDKLSRSIIQVSHLISSDVTFSSSYSSERKRDTLRRLDFSMPLYLLIYTYTTY